MRSFTYKKLCPAKQSCKGIYERHTCTVLTTNCQLPQFTLCYEPHPSTSGVKPTSYLCSDSHAAAFWCTLSQGNFWYFFKVRGHICFSVYVFLNHWTCISCATIFIRFLFFVCRWQNLLVWCYSSHCPCMYCGFFCTLLYCTVILRTRHIIFKLCFAYNHSLILWRTSFCPSCI